jgi:hypothetical protein
MNILDDARTYLMLIIDRSPGAIEEALRALRADAEGSPAAMALCYRAAAKALADPNADLTFAERESLAEWASAAAPVDTGPRDQILRVRMSALEMDELTRLADGRPLSAYVRARVFG